MELNNFITIIDDKVYVREATKKGYAIAEVGDSINLEQPNSKTRRGRVGGGVANTLTCSCNQGVLVREERMGFIEDKYENFINKNRYMPQMFNPYHEKEINDIAPTQTTYCGSTTGSATVLIMENIKEEEEMNELIKLGNIYPQQGQAGWVFDSEGICPTLVTFTGGGGKQPIILENKTNKKEIDCMQENNIKVIGSVLKEGETKFAVMNRVYDQNGVTPTIDTMQGGNRQPKILSNQEFIDKKGRTLEFRETENYIQWDTSGKGYNSQVDRAFYEDKFVGTIPAMNPQDKTQVVENMNTNSYRIRKLTPKECWRLMGFKDEQFDRAKTLGISDSGLYKQAGNSIVVDVLYNIFKKLFKEGENIRLFDSFAGIGALHSSLDILKTNVNLIGASEIDVDAIISYSGVHSLDLSLVKSQSDEYMRNYLMDRNIGFSYEKMKSSIPRLKKDKLEKCYKASVLMNNFGDISKLNYSELPDFDLFNFSFPCTDISTAGKQQGMTKEDGTTTRSGLYVYGIEVIKAKKPSYIMIENVKGLIQKKFIKDFYSIVEEIESLGYNCYYPKKKNDQPTCLNAKDFGVPQNRERIFVICVRKDVDKGNFEFPKGFDNGIRLKDILESEVDEKYYLSQEIQERFKLSGKQDINHNELNVVGSSAPDFRTIGQRDMTYGINGIMSTLTATDYKQPKQIIDNNIEVIGNYSPSGHNASRVVNKDGISPTVMDNHGTVTAILETNT